MSKKYAKQPTATATASVAKPEEKDEYEDYGEVIGFYGGGYLKINTENGEVKGYIRGGMKGKKRRQNRIEKGSWVRISRQSYTGYMVLEVYSREEKQRLKQQELTRKWWGEEDQNEQITEYDYETQITQTQIIQPHTHHKETMKEATEEEEEINVDDI